MTQRKNNGQFVKTHGLGRSRIQKIWWCMNNRCYNPRSKDYPMYGGRGINVCDNWRASPVALLADMGEPPEGKSLDRKDNDGNYEPSNCQWATPTQQARNTRSNKLISFNGKTQPMAAWAEEFGLKKATLHDRLKSGWEIERALTTSATPAILTHCKHGHEFTVENTYINEGSRHCRKCTDRRRIEWKARQLGQAAGLNRKYG